MALKKFDIKKELENKLETKQKHLKALEKTFIEENETKKRFIPLKYGYIFDKKNKKHIFGKKRKIELNKKEIDLIDILTEHKSGIVSNKIIEDYLYDGEIVGEGALRGVLFRLRQKTNKNLIFHTLN